MKVTNLCTLWNYDRDEKDNKGKIHRTTLTTFAIMLFGSYLQLFCSNIKLFKFDQVWNNQSQTLDIVYDKNESSTFCGGARTPKLSGIKGFDFDLMSIFIPVVCIFVCNVLLRRRIRSQEKPVEESRWIKSVLATNKVFIMLNVAIFVYSILNDFLMLSGYSFNLRQSLSVRMWLQVVWVISRNLSTAFPLVLFPVDLVHNRLFRTDVFGSFSALLGHTKQIDSEAAYPLIVDDDDHDDEK